jgi:hypothetical protein
MPTKVVKKPTAIVPWDEKLAALAGTATESLAAGGGGQFVSIRGAILSYNGANVPGNKIEVVIPDFILENDYYDQDFDSDNIATPACFALGRTQEEMQPHPNSPNPQGGKDGKCKGCPQNEYGTSRRGRGKACQNRQRLALITSADLENDIASADVAYLKIPPTALKSFAGYIKQLADTMHTHPVGVVTELTVLPDPKNQVKLNFRMVEKLEDGDVVEALLAKREEIMKEIEFPYQQIEREEKPAVRGKRKF